MRRLPSSSPALSHLHVGHRHAVTPFRHSVRLKEAPYLHNQTSLSTSFMYFATLGTKLTAKDKLRHLQRI